MTAVLCHSTINNFNPRSHRRERPLWTSSSIRKVIFQPTLPPKGATWIPVTAALNVSISTHAPTEGSDSTGTPWASNWPIFQPTLPPKGATQSAETIAQSIKISTHAPTEGSDPCSRKRYPHRGYFNPRSHRRERLAAYLCTTGSNSISTHAPTEGSDITPSGISHPASVFQPTLPPKGATSAPHIRDHDVRISTHAPTEGSDALKQTMEYFEFIFQPTLPPKGATRSSFPLRLSRDISTHAPTEGSDTFFNFGTAFRHYFNPRSHRRERRKAAGSNLVSLKFQPTLPPKGATVTDAFPVRFLTFQPTLPPKGATNGMAASANGGGYFNPRSHRRERRISWLADWLIENFNPRSHRRERHGTGKNDVEIRKFQPTLPPKGATAKKQSNRQNPAIYHHFFAKPANRLNFQAKSADIFKQIHSKPKIPGANPNGLLCPLRVRTKKSEAPPLECDHFFPSFQFWHRNSSPNCKNGRCHIPHR